MSNRRASFVIIFCWLFSCLTPVVYGSSNPTLPELNHQQILAEIDTLQAQFLGKKTLATIDKYLPAAEAENDSFFVMNLIVAKGEVSAAIGLAQESEPLLKRALALAQALNDSLFVCRASRWLGISLDALGRTAEARECYQRLIAIATALRLHDYLGWGNVGLGWQDVLAGKSAEAIICYNKALSHFDLTNNTRGKMWTWNEKGTALTNLGEYNKALTSLQQAAELARINEDKTIEAMALNNMGSLFYSLGAPGKAVEHFNRARDLQLQLGYTKGAFEPTLNLARCHIALGQFLDAEQILLMLLEDSRQHGFGDQVGMVLNTQAEIALSREQLFRARDLYQSTLDLRPRIPIMHRIAARIGLSKVLTRQGESAKALKVLIQGKQELSGRTVTEESLNLAAEIGVCQHNLGKYSQAIQQLLAADEQAAVLGLTGIRVNILSQAATSYTAISKGDSALVLLQRAAEVWDTERGLPIDPQWREHRGKTGRLIYTDLAALLLNTSSSLGEREKVRHAFDQLQFFKSRTLIERMLGPGNAAVASVGSLQSITLDKLQWQVLQEGELLLDFYLGPNVSFLMAITRDECRVVHLSSETTLAGKLQRYYSFISQPPTEQNMPSNGLVIQSTAASLREVLFSGVEDMIANASQIIFAPDSHLNLLPPATLFPEQKQTQTSWSRIPSATVLAYIRNRHQKTPVGENNRILALAGLNKNRNTTLPGAHNETRNLADRFTNVDLRITESESTVTVADLAGYRLLHLAAHGQVDDQNPWQSSIRFTNQTEQGILRASDIAAAKLDAQLAVLSTCESGHGRALSGEGVLGLSSAFISAGSSSVVATLWPVDDKSTAQFMDHFYGGLSDGLNIASALHHARKKLQLNSTNTSPFFWASFVVIGDGNITVTLDKPLLRTSRIKLGLLLLGAALLTLLALFPGIITRRLSLQKIVLLNTSKRK